MNWLNSFGERLAAVMPVNRTMWRNMSRLLIDYWREWRPDILRWIAGILIFTLFAWFIIDYFDYFDSCLNHASCVTGGLG